jgi:predicted HTH transcriptional regulator
MDSPELTSLLITLVNQPKECEWLEFKQNYHSDSELGESISAISNSACVLGRSFGYLVFGIQDKTHKIVGTTFNPVTEKVKNQEIENWIIQRLDPRIDFRFLPLVYLEKSIIIVEIPAAHSHPVSYMNKRYIRIGSYTRSLDEFPSKESKIWQIISSRKFESEIAKPNLSDSDVTTLLDTQKYFDLLELPYPSTRKSVIEKFIQEKFIEINSSRYSITNLGAILFAKDLNAFDRLSRKSVRVIIYKGLNRVFTKREIQGSKGYAVGFEGLVNYVNDQLPSNEEIGKAFRTEMKMFPEISIRELVANMIIHQDFREVGLGPLVEIFDDRIEFTNPGIPLITTDRFIDEFQSRNEVLASFMRRIRICEEKGSGIDKVIFHTELFQLPAPSFLIREKNTTATLYSFRELKDMDKNDRIRAAYQHACLRYVSNEKMTNQSLRGRFKITGKNAAIASRIIRETMDVGLVKEDDPSSTSRKYAKYIPFWA